MFPIICYIRNIRYLVIIPPERPQCVITPRRAVMQDCMIIIVCRSQYRVHSHKVSANARICIIQCRSNSFPLSIGITCKRQVSAQNIIIYQISGYACSGCTVRCRCNIYLTRCRHTAAEVISRKLHRIVLAHLKNRPTVIPYRVIDIIDIIHIKFHNKRFTCRNGSVEGLIYYRRSVIHKHRFVVRI